MRPFRSFLILLIFLICFAGLYYILPEGLNIKLPSVREFFPFISDVTEPATDTVKVPGTLTTPVDTAKIPLSDTISFNSTPPDSKVKIKEPYISLPSPFDSPDEQIRIMYYGDSQIEGDRVTSYLRQELRETAGGSGPGLFLPSMTVMYTRSVYIRSSSNWKRYNYLSFKNGEIPGNDLGFFMSKCRYLPENSKTLNPVKAWVRIVPSKLADSSAIKYDYLRIFYKNSQDDVIIEVKPGEYPSFRDTLRKDTGIREYTCPLFDTKNILIEFTGRVSPDIYGMSIESKEGLIIDNIPQRGSAGLEFTMIDKESLRDLYRMVSPDLFILHFGLNIVKNIRKDYSYYYKGLYRQLALLQEVAPGIPVLVVGITDMAEVSGDSIKSYPNLTEIIEAQKMAADEAGAFFWNSFEAMGGENSIVRWSDKNPPLAKKDFVHLTNIGTDTLAKMMLADLFTPPESDSLQSALAITDTDTSKLAGSDPLPADQQTFAQGKQHILRSAVDAVLKYDPDKPFIFSTAAFWIFFLVVLGGYSIIYRKLPLRNLYLFLVSLFFYYKSGGLFLILLILVTVIDFSCGLMINRSESRSGKRFYVFLSILSNIGLLAYFKYTEFFIKTINDLFGTSIVPKDYILAFFNNILGTSYDVTSILLPVGISFFTFQSLSYTFDVYRKKIEPVRNIIDFGFYVSFFPQLVAGPIVRASEFIPQVYRRFHLSKREFSHALFLISKGLIKKIVISDFIALSFIDRVFEAPTLYSGLENLLAIYGYGLQIYCDFSGYTDIAIGLALILGFRLPVNFNSPYKAVNVSDFWKRWHISLSRWLKDYLYIPLGGNRKGKLRTLINLMITMLLGGLWHGAAARFVLWGGLHGLGLVVHKIWTNITGGRTKSSRIWNSISVFLTFNFVTFCWIFFRAPDLDSSARMFHQITGNFNPGSYISLLPAYGTVFALIVAGYIIHFLPEKIKESYRGLFIRMPLAVQFLIILIVAVVLYQMRGSEIMPFIYFRF